MAVARFGTTKIDPRGDFDINFAATGATLDDTNVLQVNYNDAEFTGAEGKIRLILALRRVANRLESGDLTWPAS